MWYSFFCAESEFVVKQNKDNSLANLMCEWRPLLSNCLHFHEFFRKKLTKKKIIWGGAFQILGSPLQMLGATGQNCPDNLIRVMLMILGCDCCISFTLKMRFHSNTCRLSGLNRVFVFNLYP